MSTLQPIPVYSHILTVEVRGDGEDGDLVQLGKALADNARALTLTEEYCLPVPTPTLFLDKDTRSRK